MEFKVFKNENDKILKEYWLTPSEWDALDKTTVQEGDIYHIVGTIDKGDLSADVNASLAKGDSSLQKPTSTLAKESFVKVGIDGTQKFDDKVYATADSAKILEAKLNENIVKDPSKTYLVWKGNQFPNDTATFKPLSGCTIDWGDGNAETFEVVDSELTTHTYTDGIEYHLISLSNYTVIDNSTFSDFIGLTNVIIGNNATSINAYAFSGCSNLTSITIGNIVTSIEECAFYNCSGLTSITIGNTVTSIGWNAFENCSGLTSVTIGSGVTIIGTHAFYSCSGLKTVKISAINPPTLNNEAFYETNIEKIIVPKSAINAYKSAAGWSTYADKIVYEVDSSDLKLYLHDVTIKNNSGVKLPIVKFKYISTDNTTFSLDKFNFYKCFDVYASKNSTPPEFHGVQAITINASSISIMYYTKYPFSATGTAQLSVQIADTEINDNIYEL